MYKKLLFFLLVPVLGISQVQIGLDIDGAAPDDQFGYGVAMSADGSVIAVGAPFNDGNGTDAGHVRVYSNASGTWTQIGDDIEGEAVGDQSGFRVALSADGSVVAISAPYNDGNGTNSGQVRVYENISGIWTQIGNDIDGQIAGDGFGHGMALSANGSILAVGAPFRDGDINGSPITDIGIIQIYQNISGVWTQIGQDIQQNNMNGLMGCSGWYVDLSTDGMTIAIGVPKTIYGKVLIYRNISGVWTQVGNEIVGKSNYNEENGYRVALSADGSVVAMGARFNDDNGKNAGRVSIYKNVANNWVQVGSDIYGESAGDRCSMVALSANGEVLAVGSPVSDMNGVYSGHVRIFQNISGTWVQQGTSISGLAAGDYSGFALALSADGTNLVIGSPKLNSTSGSSAKNAAKGIGTSHIRVYDISGILSTKKFISESFDVYPNPVSDILNIRMKNDLTLEKVTVYNNSGQIVKTAQQNTVDVSNLSSGVYFVEITTNQGIASKKVIVK